MTLKRRATVTSCPAAAGSSGADTAAAAAVTVLAAGAAAAAAGAAVANTGVAAAAVAGAGVGCAAAALPRAFLTGFLWRAVFGGMMMMMYRPLLEQKREAPEDEEGLSLLFSFERQKRGYLVTKYCHGRNTQLERPHG